MGHSDIPFSNAARNLGVIFDSQLALTKQANKLFQIAHLEIRWIGSIRQYLSFKATKTLGSPFVLSRLDYYNALLGFLIKLKEINSSARLICIALKSVHITPLLYQSAAGFNTK